MGRRRRRWLWLEEEGEEEDDMMIVRVGDGWERQQDDSVAGVMAGASKVSEATCQRIPCARISCANEYLISGTSNNQSIASTIDANTD
jgi:hypothetical protein